jgi:Cytochrome c554 and c-prime
MKRFRLNCLLLALGLLFSLGCQHQFPVSAPETPNIEPEPKLELADFPEPENCASCHPNHYNEWSGSMHAYAAIDPVFLKMQERGQLETNNKLDQFCVQCHSPIARKLELTPPLYRNEELPPVGLRGVSCMACHAIAKINDTKNAEFDYNPKVGMRGPIADPMSNSYHQAVHAPFFTKSDLCGGCHNVVNARDVTIEETFDEWGKSPAAAQGQQCADCHMPVYRGQAATGGPERNVHRHFFVGVDLAMVDFPDRERQLSLVTQLLRSAAEIGVTVPDSAEPGYFMPIKVRLTSKTAGHRLPSGAVADRQMWLAVTVKDRGTGRILYKSGQLDANGDLMDRHSELNPNEDFELVVFNQQMAGNNGQDVFFSWEAYDERTVTLPPLGTVTPQYLAIIPPDARGPIYVEVRLRFRTFPPFLLRKLELPELAAQIPIIDMDEWSQEIPIKKR